MIQEGAMKRSRRLMVKLRQLDGTLDVSPSAHYMMGGVKINRRGRSNLDGLFAAGKWLEGYGRKPFGFHFLSGYFRHGNRIWP